MAKIKKNPVALNLPKNIGAMHISNELTLVERKLMNIMLFNALRAERKQLVIQLPEDNRKYYSITMAEIVEYLGREASKDTAYIKECAKKLISTVLRFNILGKQKTDSGKWDVMSGLLGAVIFPETTHEILYCFSEVIKDIVIKPTLYGTLDLKIQESISSRYTIALWEYLVSERSLTNSKSCTTPALTISQYVELIAGSSVKYEEFKHINKELIKEPLLEISEKVEFEIKPQFLKNGRKVTHIGFHLKSTENKKDKNNIKHNQPSLPDIDNQNNEVHIKLLDLGVSEKKCKEFSKKYSVPHIESNISYVLSNYKPDKQTPALIISAIDGNYVNHNISKTPMQQIKQLAAMLKPIYLPHHVSDGGCVYRHIRDYLDAKAHNDEMLLKEAVTALQTIFNVIQSVEEKAQTLNYSIWDILKVLNIPNKEAFEKTSPISLGVIEQVKKEIFIP